MIKVKLKILGCFRTLKGARMFARIRSSLSTVRKNGLNILSSIFDAFSGYPFLPAIPATPD